MLQALLAYPRGAAPPRALQLQRKFTSGHSENPQLAAHATRTSPCVTRNPTAIAPHPTSYRASALCLPMCHPKAPLTPSPLAATLLPSPANAALVANTPAAAAGGGGGGRRTFVCITALGSCTAQEMHRASSAQACAGRSSSAAAPKAREHAPSAPMRNPLAKGRAQGVHNQSMINK